jgi:flagellar hook protein FlgE
MSLSLTGAISLSGMKAAQTQLDASASNVANWQTPGYQRRVIQQTTRVDGGVSSQVVRSNVDGPAEETDMVMQLQAKSSFIANLSVFKTENSMLGSLLNEKA